MCTKIVICLRHLIMEYSASSLQALVTKMNMETSLEHDNLANYSNFKYCWPKSHRTGLVDT